MILLTVDSSQISTTIDQNPLLRDFAIAFGLLVLLVIIRVPLAIRSRHKRRESYKLHEHNAALPGGAPTRSTGWPNWPPRRAGRARPLTRTFDNQVTELHPRDAAQPVGIPARRRRHHAPINPDNRYTNVFQGEAGGQPFTIANVRPQRDAIHHRRAPSGPQQGPVGLGLHHEIGHGAAPALREPAAPGRLPTACS